MLNSTASSMDLTLEYVISKEESREEKLKKVIEETKKQQNEEEENDDENEVSDEERERRKAEAMARAQQELQMKANQEKEQKATFWEHQNFYRKGVNALTLSTKEEGKRDLFHKRTIIDNSLNRASLKKHIKLVSEVLVGFLFQIESMSIFKDDESIIDEENIDHLEAFFKKNARTPLNIAKGSQVNNELYQIITPYLTKLQKQSFEFKDIKFYDSNSGTVKVNSVKSKMIDLYILFGAIIYLLLLYILARNPFKFFKELGNTFSSE